LPNNIKLTKYKHISAINTAGRQIKYYYQHLTAGIFSFLTIEIVSAYDIYILCE